MADINFDCPHCGQNLETDESLSGSGIDCPACKKFLTIPGSAITIDLPPEPTNISTGKNVGDSLRATQLAAQAAQAARDSRAVLDQLAKRAAKSVVKKDDLHIPTKNTQSDTVNLPKFEYEANNPTTGTTEHGEISASNLADASNRLQKMGLEATSINQMKE